MAYEAKIIADSISEAGDRLTTMEVTFPRIVLAEFNTHRMFSRNSASSRAIPVEKQIRKVMDDPFIPENWGKNQKGMQAEEELVGRDRGLAKVMWLQARNKAVQAANELKAFGVHKQITNRLLEPFMWQTVICTATEWSNFFALRANPQAQPEIRVIAEMMQAQYNASTPTLLQVGEWHLPYGQEDDFMYREFTCVSSATKDRIILDYKKKASAARCARVSYLTQDGKRDNQADLNLYERLVSGGHLSPLEHVATPSYTQLVDSKYGNWHGNFKGWKQLRKFIPNEDDFSKVNNGES